MNDPDPIRDLILGSVLAAAVGDALGAPVEFDSMRAIRDRFGPDGLTDLVLGPDGTARYTDDTQMLEATARGLLDGDPTDLDETMRRIAARFVAWAREPQGGHRAPGNACLAGCRALAGGVDWREAGGPTAGGCGSVMRVAPFGLRFHGDPQRAAEWGASHSMLTHGDPIARAACAAMATGVALAVGGQPVPALLDPMIRAAEGYSARTAAMMRRARDEAEAGVQPDEVLDRLRSWAAHEAIASTIYLAARNPDDLRQALIEGANSPGDSDSIACMAGALLGAVHGATAIPAPWTAALERAAELAELAAELADASLDG
jgi:ADP-ribosylglycohydrolase